MIKIPLLRPRPNFSANRGILPVTNLLFWLEDDPAGGLSVDVLVRLIASILCFCLLDFPGYWDDVIWQQQSPTVLLVLTGTLGFLGFVAIHGYWPKQNGQTVGNRPCRIEIVDLDGKILQLSRILFRRFLPMTIASAIPGVGGIFSLTDILFILGEGRR